MSIFDLLSWYTLKGINRPIACVKENFLDVKLKEDVKLMLFLFCVGQTRMSWDDPSAITIQECMVLICPI